MTEPVPEPLDRYFAEAETWTYDRERSLRSSKRTAWIIAVAASGIAVCEALALAMLLPLKTVVPYTLLVDKQTGFVQQLDPLAPERLSGDRALTQSFLVQYVIAREEFAIDSVQNDYRKVALWSADNARRDYVAAMQASNPNSPLVRYPRSMVVQVAVKSVTPVGTNTMMIRFDTRRSSAAASTAESWVAVASYRYSGEPMRAEDRYLNPLGFQVVRYRKTQEALPAFEGAAAVQQTLGRPVLAQPVISPLTSRGGAVMPLMQTEREQEPSMGIRRP